MIVEGLKMFLEAVRLIVETLRVTIEAMRLIAESLGVCLLGILSLVLFRPPVL
jgi:hypothetical protein